MGRRLLTPPKKTYQELVDRIEELEELLGTAPILSDGYHLLGMSSVPRRMLGILMKRVDVSREQMIVAIWGHLPEHKHVAYRTVDQHIHHMRAQLKPAHVQIITIFREGFRITPADKQKLREYLAQRVKDMGLKL